MHIPSQTRTASGDWVLQFINIIFLILLFFIVNATIAAPPPPDIAPPISVVSEASQPPADALYVDRSGQLRLGGRAVTLASLAEPGTNIPGIIFVDRRLPAQKLIVLAADLKAMGVAKLSIVTVRDVP